MQFHILSFEGLDSYAQAGGIASRVSGLAQALADTGLETHLWFVGDPDLPGHETRDALQLHRWGHGLSAEVFVPPAPAAVAAFRSPSIKTRSAWNLIRVAGSRRLLKPLTNGRENSMVHADI